LNCLAVRDRLTEHAVGVLASGEATAVERHLQWCAACRKEMSELSRAVGTLTFSIAPADPPAELEDRVSDAVRAVARRRIPAARRGRILLVSVVAAAMVLSGLGYGAVMAGRASRLQDQVTAAQQQGANALQQFMQYIKTTSFSSGNKAMLANLSLGPTSPGHGSAMKFMSPTSPDLAVVLFGGLPTADPTRFPYSVRLQGPGVAPLTLGRLTHLDTGGGGTIAKFFDRDLTPYNWVVVLDAQGHEVLGGALSDEYPLPSPAP
jgi:hypothetical protein